MNLRVVVALLVGLLPVAATGDSISGVSPQSFYTGTAEDFVSISGTGLAGSDTTLMTTVVFAGPAGSFTVDASTESDTLLQVFVPVQVFSVSGTYTLTAYAHDLSGATRQVGPGSLAIVDRPPSTTPQLALPEVVIAEATGPTGAIVTFGASGTNPDGSAATLSCDHASGALYPLGTTVVTCSAGSASGTFLVVVMDTVRPTLTLPANITTSNPVVTYTATASDAIDGTITPVCDPATGSTFAWGNTYVLCTATDAHANQTAGTFLVTVNCPATTTLSVSERYFSPNGDGQKETTTVGLSIAAGSIPWTLNARNAGGTVIRSWSGSGSCIYLAWDGRDGNNIVQPDGDYTIEAINNNTGQQISSATTTIDTAAPAVSITAPANNQLFSNVRGNGSHDVTVTGSASDAHFSNWSLVQSGNLQPSITIASGTTALNGSLTWHTDALPNGSYALTLSATDLAGNAATASVSETVANFSLSQNAYQLDRSSAQTIAYSSTVPFTLTEVVTLKNSSGSVVRTLWSGSRAAGTYTDTWDGKNDQGTFVPDGPYSVTATANDGTSSMTWDESALYRPSIGVNATYPQCRRDDGTFATCSDSGITWDPYLNKPLEIVYCAAVDGGGSTVQNGWTPGAQGQFGCSGSAAALVQVKATSLSETPLSCSPSECVAQEYQPPGPHEVVWHSGLSLNGTDISQLSRLTVFRRGDIWPKNLVFAYGLAPLMTGLTINPILFNPASSPLPLAGQQFSVTVRPANPAWTVSLKAEFRNRSSGTILRTVTTTPAAAGAQTVTWDGRADNGAFVAAGIYDVTLTAIDSIGSTAVLKPVVIVRY
ncbi:MAG TPA: FlgD immunoglobulin-like domain containing protein [Thermoanaerobaculia bacterium]|nr:FlgD immunoglobulin-like domain containing protein [Thermoanaerobaculia bacterium]